MRLCYVAFKTRRFHLIYQVIVASESVSVRYLLETCKCRCFFLGSTMSRVWTIAWKISQFRLLTFGEPEGNKYLLLKGRRFTKMQIADATSPRVIQASWLDRLSRGKLSSRYRLLYSGSNPVLLRLICWQRAYGQCAKFAHQFTMHCVWLEWIVKLHRTCQSLRVFKNAVKSIYWQKENVISRITCSSLVAGNSRAVARKVLWMDILMQWWMWEWSQQKGEKTKGWRRHNWGLHCMSGLSSALSW